MCTFSALSNAPAPVLNSAPHYKNPPRRDFIWHLFSDTYCAPMGLPLEFLRWDEHTHPNGSCYGMPYRGQTITITATITKTTSIAGLRNVRAPTSTDGGFPMTQTLFRLPEVVKITQRSKSQIYRDVAAGNFPAPVKIGPRASAWRAEAVQLWLDYLSPAQK